MVTTDPSRTVCILHCGGDQETNFISHLRTALSSCVDVSNKWDLHVPQYKDDAHKATHIHTHCEHFKKKNSDVVVLLCKNFFDTLWSSPHKRSIVKMITTMKNCVHVWLDVNEDDVRRYGTVLLRTDMNFGRVTLNDLLNNNNNNNNKSADSQISMLNSLLMKTSIKTNSLNNYAVDDEIDEMRERFLKMYPSYAPAVTTPDTDDTVNETVDELRNISVQKPPKNVQLDDITRSKHRTSIGQRHNLGIGSTY